MTKLASFSPDYSQIARFVLKFYLEGLMDSDFFNWHRGIKGNDTRDIELARDKK